MSLKNPKESYTNSESEISNKESNISEKKYICDANCVCERCCLQKKLMREITEEINEINETNTKNKTLSGCSDELIKDTVDSLLNQNYVINFHSCVKENKNNTAQYYSDFTVEREEAFSDDVEKETGNTRAASDYNVHEENDGQELSTDINAENEVKGYFSNFKAKYDDMVITYVNKTERELGQISHKNLKSKKEGREYSCDFIGENKIRIFSNDLNEESRDFSKQNCRSYSSDFCEEKADKELSKDVNSNDGIEKLSLFNLKAECERQELSKDYITGKDDENFLTDCSEDIGRNFPTNFNAETELGSLSRDLNALTKSNDLSSENRDFAVEYTVDSVTDGKTFFVHFKAKTDDKEISRSVIDEKEGKELSADLKDGRNYSCECTTYEESSDASTEIYDFSNIPDCRRTRRCSKRRRDVEDFCPICGVTVRFTQLTNHFEKELENLSKLSKGPKKIRFDESQGVSTTYVQVKSNRENRHAAKVSKYSRSRNEVYCPVCNFRLTGSQDEINSHVLRCINEEGEYEEINIIDNIEPSNAEYDDENSFEEYEFGDQTRIRAISMVPGGYRSLHGDSSKPRHSCTDEDEGDLNVDVDDTLAYGNPQYTELDVIHNETDTGDKSELLQLRKAVLINPNAERHVIESRKWFNDSDKKEHSDYSSSFSDKSEANAGHIASNAMTRKEEHELYVNKEANQVISSLKEKLKDFEEQNSCVKCLICLEPYTKPVVSTTCWHVHCEECWLMTMGVKKLCPQCNMIVFPSDLRRIYL